MAEVHYFDVEVAKRYGVNCAVILQNIWHWVRKNEANGTNFHDGRYWTYNSTKAFQELFPYLSQKQIETALKKLRDEEIIVTGNYNTMKYDRTLWYAITQKGKCILLAGEMDVTSKGNGFATEGEPIPNINANITPNTKPNRKRKEKPFVPPTLEEVEAYCMERKNNVDAKRFFDYFTASDWVDSKGNKVKNWKQKIITWEGYSNSEGTNSNGQNTGNNGKDRVGHYI